MPNPTIPFRNDIEGLRGIAVLLVVAFHLQMTPISGGYIGVDIFYVISGYLISSIVQRIVTPRLASFADFYNRRIKRLLPALLFVIACTSIACWIFMLPDDLLAYSKSVRETLLIRSNRYFEQEIAAYFAPDASDLPLLHTWSLSIEWQYYLLFPALFIALKRLVPDRWLLSSAALLTAALLALSAILTTSAGGAYFSAVARGFEFMLGATIALARPSTIGPSAARTVSTLAVVGMALLSIAFTAKTTFPGFNAFLVCILAAASIYYGSGNKLLASWPLVYVGKRSYSIYLWHWPVVALADYAQLRQAGSLPSTLALIVVILLLSEVSYQLVERPGIRLRIAFPTTIVVFCALPLILAVAALSMLRSFDGVPSRLGVDATEVLGTLKRFERDRAKCNDLPAASEIEPCAFGDLAANAKALLLGDSHAQHYWAFVDVLARQARIKVYGLTNGECPALKGVTASLHGLPYKYCDEATERHYAMIKEGQYQYVFLAQRWIGYPESQLALLESSVAAILAGGATPVLLKPIAEDGRNASKCFFRHIKLRQNYADDCDIQADNDFAREKKQYVNDLFARIKRKYPKVVVVDPQEIQCDSRVCQTVVDGVPIYSDLHHLSDYGSEMLARRLVRQKGNPLLTAQ